MNVNVDQEGLSRMELKSDRKLFWASPSRVHPMTARLPRRDGRREASWFGTGRSCAETAVDPRTGGGDFGFRVSPRCHQPGLALAKLDRFFEKQPPGWEEAQEGAEATEPDGPRLWRRLPTGRLLFRSPGLTDAGVRSRLIDALGDRQAGENNGDTDILYCNFLWVVFERRNDDVSCKKTTILTRADRFWTTFARHAVTHGQP